MSEKQTCLFCGEEIKESDDVVECLYCEGLYHKECRENIAGCVVPGCYASDILPEPEDFESPLRSEENTASSTGLAEFCVKNKEYYGRVFAKFEKGKVFSFNWASFYFSCAWFVYRRMYFEAVIFLVIIGAIMVLSLLLPDLAVIFSVFIFLVSVCIPFVANYLYYRKILGFYPELKALNKDEKEAFCKKNGGTCLTGAIITGVVYYVLYMVFTAIFNLTFSGMI